MSLIERDEGMKRDVGRATVEGEKDGSGTSNALCGRDAGVARI